MLLAIVVFLFIFAVVAIALGLGFLVEELRRKQQLRRVLLTVGEGAGESSRSALILSAKKTDPLEAALGTTSAGKRLQRLLRQSQADWSAGQLLLFSSCGAAAGFGAGWYFCSVGRLAGGCVLGLLLGAAPWFHLLRRRSKLTAAFEDQLPDALDFLGRSLRAGHGLSIGLELLCADSPEPLAGVFRRVANELQLGSSLESALGRLRDSVPLVDIRFFISAVLLQQETGGNLGEILTQLSHIIRERFRLRGQVKAMSAHGRITGMILTLMPVVVAVLLFIASPEYLFVLTREKEGRYMLWGALFGQVLAFFTIRKIVNIRI